MCIKEHFTFSFPILIFLIVFSCPTAVANISNIMLNNDGDSWHPFLVLLTGNSFHFSIKQYAGFLKCSYVCLYIMLILRKSINSFFIENFLDMNEC